MDSKAKLRSTKRERNTQSVMSGTQKAEKHIDFTTLAKQIDSKIDPDLVDTLELVEMWKIFLGCDLFGNEDLISVGSSVDGSKVTMPNDSGDVDVLIVSNKIILMECLFDYDDEYPAFLHIRVSNEHEKYFKTVHDPVEGVYLPASVLKDLGKISPFVSKLWLPWLTNEGMSGDGTVLRVTRPSSVGKEQMQLYLDENNAHKFTAKPETLKFALKRMEQFVKCALGGIINIAKDSEKADNEHLSSSSDSRKRSVSNDYNNLSLSAMLHDFLDLTEGKHVDDSTTRNSLNINNRQTDAPADDGKNDPVKGIDSDKEETKIARTVSATDPLLDDEHKRKLTTESNKTSPEPGSELDHVYKYQDDINAHSTKLKEDCTTKTFIKKSTRHGKAESKVLFSKLKSVDLVPAFRFEGWPRVADEWVTRTRKWPSKLTMRKVLASGCQVVAKRPFALRRKPINEDKDPYFRLSFALSEITLAQSMKEQQLLCWRVLKAYQKCFLGTSLKGLTSYHWKNVLFWVSEDLDESFWTDENVLAAVVKCLNFMENCLHNRNLPLYFVRKMNLFKGFEETFSESLLRKVEVIRVKPLAFLKRCITEPAKPETHYIDIDEIEEMLNLEAKAQKKDALSEEMINYGINYFPSIFCEGEGEKFFQQFQNVLTLLLEKARSDREDERSSYDFKDSPKSGKARWEMIIDKFEHVVKSLKNGDKGAIKIIDDLSQIIIAHDEGLNNENNTNFERAIKESFTNISSTFSSIVSETDGNKYSENVSEFYSSLQRFALGILENVDSMYESCDESKGKQNKEEKELLSVTLETFANVYEGMQKSIKNKNFSLVDELRVILNETSEKLGTMMRREDEAEKKTEMEIDLD